MMLLMVCVFFSQVSKNDRMPQRVCALCVDKINDFYEFREMCQATNDQTRKLLNLPEPSKVKPSKKSLTIKTEDDDVESIFGIVGGDAKPKTSQTQKSAKKSKKNATITSANENRFRGMTKREIEITLELERIKKEEEEEQKAQSYEAMPTNRTKNVKKKKNSEKLSGDALLLAPKEPNQRERKREIEQKRYEK